MADDHSHFGVYAVITDEAGENILLIRKARGPYTGLWDLPGGSPEPEELLEDTLIREVAEETGTTVTAMDQIGADSLLYPYGEEGSERTLRHIGVFFAAEIEGSVTAEPDGEDSAGAAWHPLAALAEANVTPFVWRLVSEDPEAA